MPHKIRFSAVYKSIASMQEASLPDFTLVTGRNGSGKSHLLEALSGGQLQSIIAPNITDITLFTWDTLAPKDQPPAEPGKLSAIGELLVNGLSGFGGQDSQQFKVKLDGNSIPVTVAALRGRSSQSSSDLVLNARMARGVLEQMLPGGRQNERKRQEARAYLASVNDKVLVDACNDLFSPLENRCRNAVLAFDRVTSGGFEQELNKVFQMHRDLENRNSVARDRGQDDRMITLPELAPWDLLNQLFERADIPFTVDAPDHLETTSSVVVTLRKKGSREDIRFVDLSSGEKIFISFAIALYNSTSLRDMASFPKLLLLDEIDATLHPSMVKYVLRVIKDTLVKELGIKVIMTTHSPTTVALVEDAEVFEMDNQAGKLKQVGRSAALRTLTQSIPALAIEYDARVTVITEDENDASLWTALYSGLKDRVSSNVSLAFLGAGVKQESGSTQGGGCARVKTLTSNMTDAGVKRVVGMTDWDTVNTSDHGARLHVMCEGERYSIENLLLDPVVCIQLFCVRFPEKAVEKGFLDGQEGRNTLNDWSTHKWQEKINRFVENVLGSVGLSEVTSVRYRNEKTLDVPNTYVRQQGHELQDKVVAAYPFLERYSGQGKLLSTIARDISVGDYSEWYPVVVIETMDALVELGMSVEGDPQPEALTVSEHKQLPQSGDLASAGW